MSFFIWIKTFNILGCTFVVFGKKHGLWAGVLAVTPLRVEISSDQFPFFSLTADLVFTTLEKGITLPQNKNWL
jgi:hypothetical protein